MNTTADELPQRRLRLKLQLFNSLLRLTPMIAKFLLTLYMGRFFAWDDVGVYGLVFGTVLILTTVLGQRLDFIVTRDIVGVSPEIALQKIRDAVLFYCINYVALACILTCMVLFHLSDVSARIMLYIFILSVLENLGALFNSNMVALNKQLLSNAIFLVRSGLWVLPAIALGFINPVYRSYDVVLIAWSTGAIISILITIWCWRDLPWRVVAAVPVDWQWIKQGVSKSSLYWIGMIGLIGGSFADRFVINHFLDLKFVGLLTFYASFTNAMLTLMQSGVIVFSYPRLIALFRDGDLKGFRKEVWHTVWQMATGATGIALLLGVAVPFVGRLLGRPSLVENAWTFWLLLFGCWIRVNTEVFFYVLFARHQDKPLWLGNLLFLIPALGGSIILVPQIGFSGIGYSSILSCTFLLLWRLWYSRDLLLTKPDAG